MLGIDGRFATFDLSRGSPQDASIVERNYSSLRVGAPGANNAAAGTGGSSSSSGNSERAAFATLLSDARVAGGDTAVVAVASKTGFLELVAAGSLPLRPVASSSASAVTGLFPQAQSKSSSKGGGRSGANTSISSAGTPLALTLTSVHLRRLVDRAPGASGPAGLAAAAAATGGGASGGTTSGSSSSSQGGTANSADLRIAAISAGGGGGVLAIATSAGLVVLKAGWGAAMGGHTGSASAFVMHPAWSFPAFGGPYRPYGEANGSSSSEEEEEGVEDGSESSDDNDSRDTSREVIDRKTNGVANSQAHLAKSERTRKSRRLPTVASAARRGVRVIPGPQELWLCELYPLQDAQDKQQRSTANTITGLTTRKDSSRGSPLKRGNGAWLRDVAPILLDVPLLGAPPWFTQAPPACLAPVPLPAAPFSPPDSNRQLTVAPAVLASPDGSLVAVHWPFTHMYQVYRLAHNPDARLSRAASFSSTSDGSSSSASSDGGSFASPWLGTEVLRGRAISLAWVTAPSPKATAERAAVDAASIAPPARGRRNSVRSGAAATAAAAAAAAAAATATTSLPPAIVYLAALEEEPLPDSGMNSGGSNSGGSSGIGVRTLGRRRATSADGPAAAGMSGGAAGAKTVLRVFTIPLERQQPASANAKQPGVDGDDDDQRRRSSFEGPINSSSGNSSSGYSAVQRGYTPPYEALCCDAPTAPGWPSSASAASGLLGGGPLLCVNFSASGGYPDPLHHTSSSSSSSSSHGVLPMAAPSSAAFFSLDPVSPTAGSSSSASSSAAAPSSGAPPASAKSAASAPIRTPVLLRPVGSAVDGALPPAVALAWAPSLPPPVCKQRDGSSSGGGRGGGSSGSTTCAESSVDEGHEGEDDDEEEDQPRVAFLCAAGAFVMAVVGGPPPRRTPALQLEGSSLSLRASLTSVAMAAASNPPSLLWAGRNMLFVSCPSSSNGGNSSTEVWALRCRGDDDDDDENDAAGDPATNKSYSRLGSPADFQAVLMASSAPSSTPTPATADAAAGTIGKAAQLLPEGMSECLGLVAGSLVLAPRSGLPSCAAEVPNRTAQRGPQPSDFPGWNRGSLGVSGGGMASLCTLRL